MVLIPELEGVLVKVSMGHFRHVCLDGCCLDNRRTKIGEGSVCSVELVSQVKWQLCVVEHT